MNTNKLAIGGIVVAIFLSLFAIGSKGSSVGGDFSSTIKDFAQGITVSGKTPFGYTTGSGCAVTQITSRSTGVTCNGASGAITTDTTSLAAGAEAEFTVTNSSVAVGDVVNIALRSGTTANTSVAFVTVTAAGSFKIELSNLHASTADTGASIINFAVIKGASI